MEQYEQLRLDVGQQEEEQEVEIEKEAIPRKFWSQEDTSKLGFYMLKYLKQGLRQNEACTKASQHFDDRAEQSCSSRWSKVKDEYLKIQEYQDITEQYARKEVAAGFVGRIETKSMSSADVIDFLKTQDSMIETLVKDNEEVHTKYLALLTEYANVKEKYDVFVRALQSANTEQG